MNRTRIWVLGSVVVMVALAGLGWLLGVEPRLAEARAAADERRAVEELNRVHEATLAELRELSGDLPALRAELAELRSALPAEAAIAPLLGQLDALAEQSRVELTAFTADAPAEFGGDSAEAAGAANVAGIGEAGAPAAAGAGAPAAAQTAGAAPPGPRFVSIPVSVEVRGGAAGLADFIQSLQHGERLFLLTDLDITHEGGESSSRLDGLIYVMADEAPDAGPADADTGTAEEAATAAGRP